MNIILFISVILLSLILNRILIKKRLFLNFQGDNHQKFISSKNIPLSGGLILIFTSYYYINLLNFTYVFFIFCIGFLSDIKKINSPKFRFVIQTLIVFGVVYFSSITVPETKIIFLDQLLTNNIFRIFFSIFCILIVINGCNFIDGVNTSLIGYCLIVSLSLYYLDLSGLQISKIVNFYNLIPVLLALFILNFFNKLYLGDGGSYFLGLLFAICLINTYQINNNISPYFVVCLLWYPAFENLFSILRKKKLSRSPLNPDTNHLHQIIFLYLKKNFNIKNIYLNTATGMIINIYNLTCIAIATQFYSHSKIQILII
ncbi:undecaprenyl/decaprenyl-phosphate alpha-N-acetylglucosaminyl 1-phosphate transferase, partial [Candidatus Pelagibacter sp.]|nr:undecaprenyl/decaprenyl-phosphate alpha-N-acetylglucosaminyl 1-phosphate transferase [Candidatus Pelagibacter sp.]